MKILITGGSGFIGINFVQQAIARNYKIYNLDNLSLFSKDSNTSHNNYHFSKIDIKNENEVLEVLEKFVPDKIINMAAESHVDNSIQNPRIFFETNILGTFQLLKASLKFWRKNHNSSFCFHHVSTDEVFGSLKTKDKPFYENSSYKPNSPYSASKAASDHVVRSWNKTYGLPVSITHCGNNFGPYQSPEKLIPLTITNCLNKKKIPVYGNGENIRDWIYVKDHVNALLMIMEKNITNQNFVIGARNEKSNINVIQEICNLCSDNFNENFNYKDLIQFVKDRLGHDKRYAINPDLVEKHIGWRPMNNFSSSIKETFIWYLNNKNWWNNLIN